MRRTKINPVSDKQRRKLRLWGRITKERIAYLTEKYGYPLSEYSGRPGGDHELTILGGHHLDGNRNNNTPENCYICQWQEHLFIEDNNIAVRQEDFIVRFR